MTQQKRIKKDSKTVTQTPIRIIDDRTNFSKMADRYGYESQGEMRDNENMKEFKNLFVQIEDNDKRDAQILRGKPISLPDLNAHKQS